ncbi:hypothetical protein R1flu_023135 [Riccia fluitans]|uniref:Hexosyltransferase n=1 Tax=Riccia fluitans TaxID=41844 RepID=A0ABD1XV91_9MARC
MRSGGRVKHCTYLWLVALGILLEIGACRGSPVAERESSLSLIHGKARKQQSNQAYTTLLYGDEFLLGVRVLGKSIKVTGTDKDMVVLVSKGVSSEAMELLEADGWIVEHIDLLENPNSKKKRPSRFWGVYTKLKIFNMTNYEKVVYLDADTIVTRSIEDLFLCKRFCANLKHSERLNSGVMVVEPSRDLFEDMLAKVTTLKSYTGGDQGFLNSYFEDFANARLFDPLMSPDERKEYNPEFERLSTLYNADVGLYMLANKWMVDDESELRVVHYTLGPLKPWDWWCHWLLKPVDLWQNVRVTLVESLPGTRAGETAHSRLVVRVLFLIPLIVLAFCNRRLLCQIHQDVCGLLCTGSFCGYARQLWYKYTAGSALPIYSKITGSPSNTSVNQYTGGTGGISGSSRLPTYLGSLSVVVCFICALGSMVIAVLLVPRQVMPWTGMILAYEWTFFLFIVLFGKYLDVLYGLGRSSAVAVSSVPSSPDASGYNSGKGHSRSAVLWDAQTVFYGLGMAFFAMSVPAVPFILGVSALFARLGLMITMGLVLSAFMTYAAEHLAIKWYLRGRDEWNQSRPQSGYCGIC